MEKRRGIKLNLNTSNTKVTLGEVPPKEVQLNVIGASPHLIKSTEGSLNPTDSQKNKTHLTFTSSETGEAPPPPQKGGIVH